MLKLLTRLLRCLPLVGFLTRKLASVKRQAEDGVQNVRQLSFRGGLIGLITAMILWISIFLYVAFYYAYMPSVSHVRPIHVQFKACQDEKGLCSFPSAHVQLTKRQQLLMVGQPYKIYIQLEMPESPANKELGMFMVCASLLVRSGVEVAHACRSAMLHYRSPLLEALTTLALSPFMVLGHTEEKQSVTVELFSDFEEDQNQPVTDVRVEIQTRHVELYSATMFIHAHFTGLRYLMFHWPILSAAIGISSNLFFILLIFSLSWWHLSQMDESEGEGYRFRKLSPTEAVRDKDGFEFEGEVVDELEDISLLDDPARPNSLTKSLSCPGSPNNEKLERVPQDPELEDIKEPGAQEVPRGLLEVSGPSS